MIPCDVYFDNIGTISPINYSLPRLREKSPIINLFFEDVCLYDFFDLRPDDLDFEIPYQKVILVSPKNEKNAIVPHETFFERMKMYNDTTYYNGYAIICALFDKFNPRIDKYTSMSDLRFLATSIYQHQLIGQKLLCTKTFAKSIYNKIIYYNVSRYKEITEGQWQKILINSKIFNAVYINDETKNISLCKKCRLNKAYKNDYCFKCI